MRCSLPTCPRPVHDVSSTCPRRVRPTWPARTYIYTARNQSRRRERCDSLPIGRVERELNPLYERGRAARAHSRVGELSSPTTRACAPTHTANQDAARECCRLLPIGRIGEGRTRSRVREGSLHSHTLEIELCVDCVVCVRECSCATYTVEAVRIGNRRTYRRPCTRNAASTERRETGRRRACGGVPVPVVPEPAG